MNLRKNFKLINVNILNLYYIYCRTNSYCGTLHSMSPEFFDEKIDYSFEVDTYAVGILIFELVVGVPPFGYFVNDIDKE